MDEGAWMVKLSPDELIQSLAIMSAQQNPASPATQIHELRVLIMLPQLDYHLTNQKRAEAKHLRPAGTFAQAFNNDPCLQAFPISHDLLPTPRPLIHLSPHLIFRRQGGASRLEFRDDSGVQLSMQGINAA